MTTIRADRVGFPKGEVDVYLIHLSPRYKGAGHYIGSTERHVGERFAEHLNGGGSALTRAAQAAGCELSVARVWRGVSQGVEFLVKSRAEGPSLCPLCNPNGWRRLAEGGRYGHSETFETGES